MTTHTKGKAASFGYRVARVFSRAWHLTDRPERALGHKVGHTVAKGIFLLFKAVLLVALVLWSWRTVLPLAIITGVVLFLFSRNEKDGDGEYYDYSVNYDDDKYVIESNSHDYGYDRYTDPIRADFDPCGAYHSMFDNKY